MKTGQTYYRFALSFVMLILIIGCDQIQAPTNPEGTLSDVAKTLPKSVTCVTPPSGLISWWPGDGNANDIIGGHNGTLVNGATFATGFVTSGGGQAFSFDGVDDFVSVPDNDLWAFASDFTIDLWVNFSSPVSSPPFNPGAVFIGNDEGSGEQNKWFFGLGNTTGNLELSFHINGPSPFPAGGPLVGQCAIHSCCGSVVPPCCQQKREHLHYLRRWSVGRIPSKQCDNTQSCCTADNRQG